MGKTVAQLTGEHAAFSGSFPLTKREYFAGLAMQGQLANGALLERFGLQEELVAHAAVGYADVLLAELSK